MHGHVCACVHYIGRDYQKTAAADSGYETADSGYGAADSGYGRTGIYTACVISASNEECVLKCLSVLLFTNQVYVHALD